MKQSVLVVDDDPEILGTFQLLLGESWNVGVATSGAEAIAMLERGGTFGVIIADVGMPEMNGTELLSQVKQRWPNVVRIMLTGDREQKTAVAAVNDAGIFRFLNKPGTPEQMAQAVTDGMRHHELLVAERDLLENTLKASVAVLTDMIAMADPALLARTQKLQTQVTQICRSLHIADVWEIDIAVMMLNIGNMTVPPELLLKGRRGDLLSAKEQEVLRRMPVIGSGLLARIPRLEGVARIVLYQSKHYDGSGFPTDNVAGKAIPVGARIIKVASDRLKLELKGMKRDAIGNEMWSRIGWYDPAILDAANAIVAGTAPPFPPGQAAVRLAGLRAGQQLAANLETPDGVTLVSAGYIITESLLERVQNFAATTGIKEPIYIEKTPNQNI